MYYFRACYFIFLRDISFFFPFCCQAYLLIFSVIREALKDIVSFFRHSSQHLRFIVCSLLFFSLVSACIHPGVVFFCCITFVSSNLFADFFDWYVKIRLAVGMKLLFHVDIFFIFDIFRLIYLFYLFVCLFIYIPLFLFICLVIYVSNCTFVQH